MIKGWQHVVTGRYYETTPIDGISIIYIVDWLLSDKNRRATMKKYRI